MIDIRAYVLTIEPEGGARRRGMASEMDRSGYEWQFFDGVTADKAPRELAYSPIRNALFNSRNVTPPELGCYASHRAIWRQFLESGDKAALVFEDDARISDDSAFHASVADLTRNFGLFDIVKFHDHAPKRIVREATVGTTRLVSHKMIATSAACYLVTRQGAQKMLECRPAVFRAIDDDWTHAWEMGVNIWSVSPNPVATIDDGKSAIEVEREAARQRRSRLRSAWNICLTVHKQMKTASYHRRLEGFRA